MKIEVNDEQIDELVKQWLAETVDIAQTGEWDHGDDRELWAEMGQLAGKLLKLNWRVG